MIPETISVGGKVYSTSDADGKVVLVTGTIVDVSGDSFCWREDGTSEVQSAYRRHTYYESPEEAWQGAVVSLALKFWNPGRSDDREECFDNLIEAAVQYANLAISESVAP